MPRRDRASVFSNSLFTDTATLIKYSGGGYRNNYGEWVEGDSVSRSITVIAEPIDTEEYIGNENSHRLEGAVRFFLEPNVDIDVLQTTETTGSDNAGATSDLIVFKGEQYRAYKKLQWDKYIEVEANRVGQQVW